MYIHTYIHVTLIYRTEGQRFPEDLLDLYLYYAIVGLGQQAASLRAAALSMLVIVADDGENGVTLIMPQLDKLAALKEDGWWEVCVCVVCVRAFFVSVSVFERQRQRQRQRQNKRRGGGERERERERRIVYGGPPTEERRSLNRADVYITYIISNI